MKQRRSPRVVVESVDDWEESDPASRSFISVWWPAFLGILMAIIAPEIHNYVVAQWAETGERLVFPFMLLSGRPEFGFDAEFSQSLPQIVELLTFPFFGLYLSWSVYRRIRFGTAFAQVVFVNLLAAFVLWLLSKPGASHGM